jgi:hypothetical protein
MHKAKDFQFVRAQPAFQIELLFLWYNRLKQGK